jgi:hypothetical protein
VDAAVHNAPALHTIDAVAQQPQVDVVQRKGQGHANPFNAGCHLQRATAVGQGVAQWVMELHFQFVHGGAFLLHN